MRMSSDSINDPRAARVSLCGECMMKTLLVVGIVAMSAWAQGPSDPPPIIQLTRKPGIGGKPIRPYGDAKAQVDVVGLTAMTGPPETWLVELHLNYASLEDLDRGLTAVTPLRTDGDASDPFRDDVLAPSRTMIGTYQQNWSYRPEQAIQMFRRARYFVVSVYRIRAGTEADYGELVKLRRASQDSVNLDRPDICYEVISESALLRGFGLPDSRRHRGRLWRARQIAARQPGQRQSGPSGHLLRGNFGRALGHLYLPVTGGVFAVVR